MAKLVNRYLGNTDLKYEFVIVCLSDAPYPVTPAVDLLSEGKFINVAALIVEAAQYVTDYKDATARREQILAKTEELATIYLAKPALEEALGPAGRNIVPLILYSELLFDEFGQTSNVEMKGMIPHDIDPLARLYS